MLNQTIHSKYDITEDPIFKSSQQIWTYSAPILLVLGTVTNILTIIVLLRKKLRRKTTIFYLTILSIINLLTLYIGLGKTWLMVTFDVYISVQSEFLCRFSTFALNLLLNLTVWILVAVTVDRCIIVCLPQLAKRICLLKYSKGVAAGMFVVLAIANMHLFWGVAIRKTHGSLEKDCTHGNDFNEFIFPWLSLTLGFIVPFVIMVIANSFIIRCIYLSNKRLAYHHSNDSKNSNSNHNKRLSSVTSMLLATNATFMILTLPIMIFLIVEPYHVANEDVTANMHLTWAIVNICDYTDHSVNFFLYCLAGTTFRRELRKLLKGK
ncbi:cysteinyl leukotriene receptor 1-like [Saccostrea echinata]|uniref:cysteinyl leukotriene receptor 1-like n=1 Tax=Saccostrea echinata TaxID=191078 RepID=UPI002A8172BC|nr:cysteinyl leukotriene receptor 1-like [Saccostrea echinata]